ncbi:MAG: TIGR03915 family putative DNA repair protein [Pirellulales bacterium]
MSMLSTYESVWAAPIVSARRVATYRIAGFGEWRSVARRLLDAEMSPEDVAFVEGGERQRALAFGDEATDHLERESLGLRRYLVPKGFVALARTVACHRDPTRWTLLYRLLWRLTHGEPRLLAAEADDDVIRVRTMEKQVERDAQRMKSSVRFRQVTKAGEVWFAAWHRPSHHVVRMVASFFVERFAAMKWSIETPEESISWNGEQLLFGPGASRNAALFAV